MQRPVMKPKLIRFPKMEFKCLGIVSFRIRLDAINVIPAENEKTNLPIVIVHKF